MRYVIRSPVRHILCILVCLGVAASPSRADDEKPAYKLNLKPAEGLPNGKVATLQGTANPAGDKFFVESVGVLQPVVVTLVAKNKGDAIKLVLAKQRWDEDLRHGTTGPDGMVTFKLRTQGELRMVVSGDGDKPYNLIVWVGDEVKPDFAAAPAITPMKDHKVSKAGGAAGSNTTGIVIACVLGGLIVVLVVWLKRKGAKR
jgi:hypothetical protein